MSEHILDNDNFKAEVLESQTPVLVDFFATWCGPCRMLAPLLTQLSDRYDKRVKICKLDVDVAPEIAQSYNVSSIPTLIMFKDGKPVAQRVGGASMAVLDAFINDSI